LLRTATKPEELAVQRDGCGDSALAWAAYKARDCRTAWFELISQLLILSPADAQKRSKSKFLPLHEAAWGNAPAAIAVLLSAAHPSAVDDKAPGQTPHEVGHYHHTTMKTRCRFSWPLPEQLHHMALELRGETEWLKRLAAGDLLPLAELVIGFMREVEASNVHSALPIIAEENGLYTRIIAEEKQQHRQQSRQRIAVKCSKRTCQQHRRQRILRRRPRGDQVVLPVAPLPDRPEEVDYLRELSAKDTGRFAGLRQARNTHSAFKEMMCVVDGAGATHCLAFHAVRTLPRSLQRRRVAEKWPSKVDLRRQRAWERNEKAFYQCLGV
jgi:hypothetical protein